MQQLQGAARPKPNAARVQPAQQARLQLGQLLLASSHLPETPHWQRWRCCWQRAQTQSARALAPLPAHPCSAAAAAVHVTQPQPLQP